MPDVGLFETSLPHFKTGKTRDIYEISDKLLLFVSSDRISIFDVVLNDLVPNKGRVLNAMSNFWYETLKEVVPNQVVELGTVELPKELSQPYFLGRLAVAKRAEMIPLECKVRGHLGGSAWRQYKLNNRVNGLKVPAGMKEADKLPDNLFTPSMRAANGQNENITFDQAVSHFGGQTVEHLREVSLSLFDRMYQHALSKGITIADAKFEFGFIEPSIIALCGEVGTPDTSRFWSSDKVVPGSTPPSYDKQYIIDYLTKTVGWDKQSLPPPSLPNHIISLTAQRYIEAYERLTNQRVWSIPGALIEA